MSCLGRVFNFKLGSFSSRQQKWFAHTATSRVENSAQVSSFRLRFVHSTIDTQDNRLSLLFLLKLTVTLINPWQGSQFKSAQKINSTEMNQLMKGLQENSCNAQSETSMLDFETKVYCHSLNVKLGTYHHKRLAFVVQGTYSQHIYLRICPISQCVLPGEAFHSSAT